MLPPLFPHFPEKQNKKKQDRNHQGCRRVINFRYIFLPACLFASFYHIILLFTVVLFVSGKWWNWIFVDNEEKNCQQHNIQCENSNILMVYLCKWENRKINVYFVCLKGWGNENHCRLNNDDIFFWINLRKVFLFSGKFL